MCLRNSVVERIVIGSDTTLNESLPLKALRVYNSTKTKKSDEVDYIYKDAFTFRVNEKNIIKESPVDNPNLQPYIDNLVNGDVTET